MTPEQPRSSGMVVIALALIAILGVVAVAMLRAPAPITVQNGPQSPDRNILTVTGTNEMQVAPDEARLTLEVVTRNNAASVASSMNRDLMNKVVAALKANGVSDAQIETTNVYLQKVTEWDQGMQKNVDKGYEQRTTIRVTVQDLTKVGSILDGAVEAGANSVQDIEFRLTPEAEAKYKAQSLTAAAKVAKSKAQTLADASGATLGRITSLSENNYNIQPYYYNTRSVMADAKGAMEVPAPSTPINPEMVSVSVSVNIAYELQ